MGDNSAGQDPSRPMIDIYARLSYSVNGETIQVDDQVEMGEETVVRRGAVVGAVFKDPSKSAWHPRVIRPQWEALMARLESGASDGVWVYDLTRFSRKVLEGERLVELAARGLRVWSQSGEYDLTTADGRAHFREAMVAAARESDKISERTKRGNYRRARRGRSHGGPRAFGLPGWAPVPPGWEPGDPRERVPDEQVAAERAIVRECYDRLFAGESLAALVGDLNARGVLTNFGKPWGRSPLRKVLSRASVAGLLEFRGGEVVGQLAGVEPIVSREEWERMLAIFAGRRRGRPAGLGTYVLSGLVRCARCGNPLYGAVRPNMKPYQDGSVRREYRCRTSADSPRACGRNLIDFRVAEEAVGEAVKARLGDPRRADRIGRHLAAVRAERDEIYAEIAALEESADGLAEKTAEWGLERVNKAMRPITARLETLNAKLASLETPESPVAAAEDAARAWDEAWERGDIPALRAMVKRAFPRLALRPGEYWGDHSPARFDWDGQSLTEIDGT
jgi:DNA invertase Pin-like site-specific DNA recombinase